MLVVFYAHTDECKHNDCFLKTKIKPSQYVTKLHKTSKCLCNYVIQKVFLTIYLDVSPALNVFI